MAEDYENERARLRAGTDQAMAAIPELARFMGGLFASLLAEEFTREEAMQLVIAELQIINGSTDA